MEGDDFDWKPPSEAEMKVLQVRRERSDKISKLMGDYLLKGYRMLGSCCSVCGTILLRDRQQQDYCVACCELDTDLAKDDPAVSASAAKSQVEEHELCISSAANHSHASSKGNGQSSHVTPPGKRIRHTSPSPRSPTSHSSRMARSLANTKEQKAPSGGLATMHIETKDGVVNPRHHRYENYFPGKILDLPSSSPDIVSESMETVMGKLYWASQQLKGATSVEASTQLCILIKACADAMTSLRYLVPGESTD